MHMLDLTISDMLLVFLIHTTVMLTVIAQHNLTPYGTATQSSRYKGTFGRPENAIHPPISNKWSGNICTHTIVDRSSTPADWWMFQFSFGSAYITNITIYYREGLARRMDGFKLCVTNTSITPPDNDACYEDPAPGLPNIIQTIPFNQLGKYVIYYDDKGSTEQDGRKDSPVVELCYVAINGCQQGFWGSNCSTTCADNCIEGNCFPGNGSCVWGCDPTNCLNNVCNRDTAICTDGCKKGRTGNHCNKSCNGGKYGKDCLQECSANCLTPPCDHITGECSNGCNDGWLGSNCTQKCPKGHFGQKCLKSCDGCLSNLCEHIEGLCHNNTACKPGYAFGEYCNTACVNGNFGTNCSDFCDGCLSFTCNHIDGLCADKNACNAGYVFGDYCNKECSIGQFGTNCSEICKGCRSYMCDNADGLCDDTDTCNPGYFYGDYCNKACDNWYFGHNCSMECNCLAEPCDKENGICPFGGCKEGWHSDSCSKRCNKGKFGRNCNDSCDGCLANRCEATDGLCYNTTGCKPGYYFEEYCNNTCDDCFFGTNCSRKCNCLHGPCNWFTGMCPSGGCEKGWKGESCDEGCDQGKFGQNCNDSCDGCISNSCDVIDGLCVNTTGCEPGYHFEEYCNNTCDDWYFGYNCTGKCYCLTEPCSRFSGKCQSGGCQKGWHGESCGEAISEFQQEDPPYAAAVGGGATAVILILLIVVVFIIFRRRSISSKDRQSDRKSSINETSFDTSKKTSNKHNYANIDSLAKTKEDTSSLTESEETESQIVKIDDVNVYGNVLSVSKYKIMIGGLKAAIYEKQKGENFKKEYEILQKGLLYPHVEGSKEENKVRNRFLSLWPYDHSRVVLKGDTTHDYINASYIDNYEKERAYIAAQGPKNETFRDFWHMIWQENVGKVVMVTQLKENRKIKCTQYWPKSVTKPLAVNNYIVTMKEERKHTVYVYRLFTVLNKNAPNEKERQIHHFHFTQWPDHGVPDSIKLVSFYRKVKIEKCYQNGPMVVHCSAGVGRTGTFIAIDALYENGKNVGYVNIMECIEMMRKDRMNMVQTYEQYEAVFEALLELFNVPETSIPKTDFCKYISDQEHKTVPKNQNMYKVEFQRLETLRPMYPQSAYTAATSKENIHKNAAKKIFPHDKYRPYLMSYGKTRNDYINAVIVPGYEEKSKLLVTQCPLEKTVVDFWTMVYDHQSTIVVLLDQLNMNAPLWLEQHEVLEFEQFNIVQENISNPDELQLTLTHENQGERTITVFTPNKSNVTNDTMLPSNIILDLLKNVNDCWEENKGPITVVCSDGCSKSGIFVALRLILEKLAIDEEIDIFQVVRTIQVRRPEFLMDFDQYEYCYKCIKDHLENESLYANV